MLAPSTTDADPEQREQPPARGYVEGDPQGAGGVARAGSSTRSHSAMNGHHDHAAASSRSILEQSVDEERLRVRRWEGRFLEAGRGSPRCRRPSWPVPRTCRARPGSSIGPSDRRASPRRNRLVTKWNPNTARSVAPKSTQVVGWVNAAAIPIRKSAVRAPHDVRAAPRNASIRLNRKSTGDVVEVADVGRGEEQRHRLRAAS